MRIGRTRIPILAVLALVGSIITFLWVNFVEPNRKLCDELCILTGRIAHEDTFGDDKYANMQRGEFWAKYDSVELTFHPNTRVTEAVSKFAGLLENTGDPGVKTIPDDALSRNPNLKPFGQNQQQLMQNHKNIERACKRATWTLWQ
jgi:hypothetical protein